VAVLSALASSLLLVPLSFRPLQMSMQFGSKSSPLLLLLSFRPLQMVMRIWIQAVVAVFVLCVHLAAVFAASCLDRGRRRRFAVCVFRTVVSSLPCSSSAFPLPFDPSLTLCAELRGKEGQAGQL